MEIDRLKYYIAQRLQELTSIGIYDAKVPNTNDITFPYCVYKLYACNYAVRHRKDWILEIDFWNDSDDDTEILSESIAVKNGDEDSGVIGLNNSTQDEAEGFYKCEIEFEAEIPETEPGISRYNQRYLLKVD